MSFAPHRYNNGLPRPYSLKLGRAIKQKLWESLNRPLMMTSVSEDGRVEVAVSYGVDLHPPMYDVDVSLEPEPENPPRKRAKKLH